MKSERPYLRFGDVHTSPAGVPMWVFAIDGADVVMRPIEGRDGSANVSAPIAEVAYRWPRVDDLGGRVAWIEPSEVLA